MMVEFTLDGVEFVALNAGPQFKFTEAEARRYRSRGEAVGSDLNI